MLIVTYRIALIMKSIRFIKLIIFLVIFFFNISIINSQYINGFQEVESHREETIRSQFNKFIVITWDGTRDKWLDEYSKSGELSAVQALREEGGEAYLRLGETPSTTDPCLATIETGFGPRDHKILANQFSSSNPGVSIPDGLQTSERLKQFFGDNFTTGHLNSWMHHDYNDSMFTIPEGHITQNEMIDTIFFNAQPGKDVDFWFGSENISWIPENTDSHNASLDEYWYGSWIHSNITDGLLTPYDPHSYSSYGYVERFSNTYNQNIQYWKTPLINAQFLANKATEFIDLYSSGDFYLRIHMTEPDYLGHRYGESTDQYSFKNISPEYLLGLKECDSALEKIRQSLVTYDIYNDTFILVGADHGFLGTSHSEDPVLYISNQKIWGYFVGQESTTTYGYLHDIQPTLLSLAGADWSAINYPLAIPLYDQYGNNTRPTSTIPNTESTTMPFSNPTSTEATSMFLIPSFLAISLIIIIRKQEKY